MKIVSIVAAGLFASSLFAGEMEALASTTLNYTGVAGIKATSAKNLPEPEVKAAKVSGVTAEPVTNDTLYLFPTCSKQNIIAYPKTQAEYDAFYARFSKILQDAGITITSAKFSPDMSIISYSSPEGIALRRFSGEALTYDATHPEAITLQLKHIQSIMENNNLPVAASYLVNSDIIRHTYVIYYFTKYADRQEDEKQLRVLNTGGDTIYYDLLPGVNVVRKDQEWQMAYIGPEVGFVTGASTSSDSINASLNNRINTLTKMGCKILGSRIFPVSWNEMPEYKFIYHLYFYR